MKKSVLLLGCSCLIFSATAQNENIQYQLMEGYSSSRAFAPQQIAVPNIPGYQTLKCDFHIHTHYSDGQVTPEMRVFEAWKEGLDAISITDHQPMPRTEMNDCNISYNKALPLAKSKGLMLIRGLEITGTDPIGHLNFLFIEDCNDYMPRSRNFSIEDTDSLIEKAVAEGAYITTNHPGWPDKNSEIPAYILRHIEKKHIRGVEIFNNEEFYPRAIDYADQYDLAYIGASDAHYPTSFLFDLKENHRPLTLVFAEDKTPEALKEALVAGRTIAWTNNILAGKESLLKSFLRASLRVESLKMDDKRFHVRIVNESEIPYLLDNGNPDERIRIPARGICEMNRPLSVLSHPFKVSNMYVSSVNQLEIPVSYLIQEQGSVDMPFVDEQSIAFQSERLTFRLSCGEGETYYTLDGSEPSRASVRFDNKPIVIDSSCLLKACTFKGDRRSSVYERRLVFSLPVKCKAKKNGVSFNYYEGDFKSVRDLGRVEEMKEKGRMVRPSIGGEWQQEDHFGYVYEGYMYAPVSGTYQFALKSNDGSDLFINGERVVDNDRSVGYVEATGSVYLQKGYHSFKLRFFEGYGGEHLSIEWSHPEQTFSEVIPDKYFYIE